VTDHDRVDDSLRGAFDALRVADERGAPSFEDVVAGRAGRNARVWSYWPRLAIAAGLVITAGVAYRAVVTRPPRLAVPSEVVALAAWRAPTDILLETPAKKLLTGAPRLGASLIDTGITGGIR